MKIATDLDVRGALTVAGLPIAAGSVILSGTATPVSGTGAVGDYYFDTDDKILYGPKAGAYGSGQSLYTTEVPDFDGNPMIRTWGRDITFSRDGRVTALKYYRMAGNTNTTTTMTLYSSGGAVLATASTTAEETGAGWRTATLASPVVVSSGQTVRTTWNQTNPNHRWNYHGSATNFTNGYLTAGSSWATSSLSHGYPTQQDTGNYYFADVVYEPTTVDTWPVALKSVPAGGTTSQVLAKTSATDYAATWATPAAGGAAATRETVSKTTASLAAAASEASTIQLGASYRLLKITTSAPARVRLYTTAAKRDADAGRSLGTDPTGDSGLMLEFATATGALSADLSPVVDGFDGKATPDGLIPYSITNLGTGAAVITVGLDWVRTEG